MALAGYSNTPLIGKLGLKPGLRLWVLNPPDGYYIWLETDVRSQLVAAGAIPDWAHLFARNTAEFTNGMTRLKKVVEKNRSLIIWVSWYKRSAGIPTDLTEDGIRNYALQNGLVDIKVCAVSEQWSGLKLVVPLALRKPPATKASNGRKPSGSSSKRKPPAGKS